LPKKSFHYSKFNIYDVVAIALLVFAFFIPDLYYAGFISSVFQTFALFNVSATSNYQFTILWLRATLAIFGFLFLLPRVFEVIFQRNMTTRI